MQFGSMPAHQAVAGCASLPEPMHRENVSQSGDFVVGVAGTMEDYRKKGSVRDTGMELAVLLY